MDNTSKWDESEYTGLTDTMKRVIIKKSEVDNIKIGDYLMTRIDEAHPNTLFGTALKHSSVTEFAKLSENKPLSWIIN